VVLHRGASVSSPLPADATRNEFAGWRSFISFVFATATLAVTAQREEHLSDAIAKPHRIEASRDEVELCRLCVDVRLLEQEIKRGELVDVSSYGLKSTARLVPEKRRLRDVIGVRPNVCGTAVSTGIELKHASATVAAITRLAVDPADWAALEEGVARRTICIHTCP
jgi:hypothetical protein